MWLRLPSLVAWQPRISQQQYLTNSYHTANLTSDSNPTPTRKGPLTLFAAPRTPQHTQRHEPTSSTRTTHLSIMQVFITFLLATMAAATPVSTEAKFVISHDLTMRELEASNKLLFDDSKIAPRDDYGSCNWVRCSQGDTVLWSAACRGDPKPASLCAICNCKTIFHSDPSRSHSDMKQGVAQPRHATKLVLQMPAALRQSCSAAISWRR